MSRTIAVLMVRDDRHGLRDPLGRLGVQRSLARGQLVLVNEGAIERTTDVDRQQQMSGLVNITEERQHRERGNDRRPNSPSALATDSTAKRLHEGDCPFLTQHRRHVNINAIGLQVR